MAKHEPKLGDVRYQNDCNRGYYYNYNEFPDRFRVSVFLGGKWDEWSCEGSAANARRVGDRLRELLKTVIREARDNGANDAIAVVQKLSDEWTGCTLDDVYDDAIALIREKTGVAK